MALIKIEKQSFMSKIGFVCKPIILTLVNLWNAVNVKLYTRQIQFARNPIFFKQVRKYMSNAIKNKKIILKSKYIDIKRSKMLFQSR